MKRWVINHGGVDRVVEAVDQHAAWNVLRKEPGESFGLIVGIVEEGKTEEDRIFVHTTGLFLAWGRDEEARQLLDALKAAGIEDFSADLGYAFAHGRTAPFVMEPSR